MSPVRLALLVNRYTASAAEVVAAALRDNERASLVGERTYGKALVQSIEPLPSRGALKLTTARYVTPSGTDISRRGLLPDVEVVDDPAPRKTRRSTPRSPRWSSATPYAPRSCGRRAQS